MSSKGWIHETTAFVLASALAGPAASQNVLSNPDFDSDVAGWTLGSQEFIVITWSASDVDGSPASGSAELNTAVTGSAYQCVPIAGGDSYSLSGAVAPLSGGSGVIDFSLEAVWNDGPDCAGDPVGVPAELPSPEEEDVWHPLSGDFEAPPEAQSAQVRLKSTWTSGTRSARFDAIFLPEPSPGLASGVGGLALWVLARRRRTR
jgi:hypothetical protein